MAVCPLVDFYVYEGKCPVTTCQHNTTRTCNGCMIQDRQERSDRITDAEILFYKIRPNPEQFSSKNPDVKFASYIRKRFISMAKGNMTLYMYVTFCKNTQKPSSKFDYAAGKNAIIDEAINSFPLNQKELHFEPWMIYYLYNPKFLQHFIEKQDRTNTEAISIHNVLCTTPKKYNRVVQELKTYSKGNKK